MVPQVGHCPNFKLGQWLTWGTKGPTLKLPQFKIRAMVNLGHQDRKSTRLNSSHDQISYAVFCLKKKKKHLSSRIHPNNQLTRPNVLRINYAYSTLSKPLTNLTLCSLNQYPVARHHVTSKHTLL